MSTDMRRHGPAIAVSIAFLAVSACGGGTPAPPAQSTLGANEATAARRAIAAWLECEECTDGELEAVVKLGDVSVPMLAASLRGGTSPASREKLRLHLVATYKELTDYARTHPESKPSASEEEYVRTYLDNYDALQRMRAAKALGAIGGPSASAALQEALQAPLRGDVQAAVTASVEQLKKR